MCWPRRRELPAPDDGLEAALLRALGPEPVLTDLLVRQLDASPDAVGAALVMLELKGLAKPATPTSWIIAPR